MPTTSRFFNDFTLAEQDQLILERLPGFGKGGATFAMIHADVDASLPRSARPLDRALQRLRKRGAIELKGKPRRWQKVSK